MKKSFRTRLRRLLLLGTVIPAICFISIFFYQYYNININSEKALFEREVSLFELGLNNKLAYYEQLLETSLTFLDDQILTTKEMKKDYLEGLLNINELDHYYFIDEDDVFSNNPQDETLKEKVTILKDQSHNKEYWISKFDELEENSIYFGYTNPGLYSGLIVFQLETERLFLSLEEFIDSTINFDILYNNEIIYSSSDTLIESEFSNDKLFRENSKRYIGKHSNSQYPNFDFNMYMDISREINFLNKNLGLFSLIIVVYLMFMALTIFKTSSSILTPLNKLIEVVASVVDGDVQKLDLNTKNDEYKEVFDMFNEMVHTTYRNIESIEDQSEIMKDKNKIMSDLNNQLSLSTELIEASTRKLRIFEKQSKTLVDNIKDLMWVVDSKGRIIYINNIVEDKLGYTAEELIGVKLENILKQNSENEEAIQDMFTEDHDDLDLIFIKKNNESEEIFASSTKRIYINEKLVKIQGVSRDITEERFLELQMIQKKEISNTLNEISEILTRPEKLEILLDHIVVRIERLLDPIVTTIRLLDEKGRLELKAGIGECYSLVQEKYLDIDKDISGRAIKESKIIIVTDNNRDFYDNYDEVFTIIDRSKELIFLPLEYDESIIGVMSIGLRESISDAQLKILKVFTNQASAAIEKARMYEELENNYLNIIKALASTVEAKDAYTEDHSIRVSHYSRLIAEELGMSDDEVAYIDIAGLLHDIGKIGVSDLTLTKQGRLSELEFLEIMKHPLNGGRIVSEMKLHDHIIEGVLLHHKRFDLKGYPDIYVESLPISARIIGVADAFDAMTSNRSYQKARSYKEAFEELSKNSGTQFCPEIVNVMGRVIDTMQDS